MSGALAWAISNIIVKKVLHSHNKWQFSAYQMLIGAIVLFLYSFLFEQGGNNNMELECFYSRILRRSHCLCPSVFSAFGSISLSSGEGGKTTLSLLLVPVVSILSGWIFFRRSTVLHFNHWWGAHDSTCYWFSQLGTKGRVPRPLKKRMRN